MLLPSGKKTFHALFRRRGFSTPSLLPSSNGTFLTIVFFTGGPAAGTLFRLGALFGFGTTGGDSSLPTAAATAAAFTRPAPPPALPAPALEPAPTAPAAIVRYSSQRPRRERTRSGPPRAKAKPSAAPAAPVPTPLLPAPEPVVPKPSAAEVLQIEDTAAPSAAPAKPTRARAKPSARPIKPSMARPNPAPVMWTTGPVSEEALPPKRARKEGKGKGSAPKAAPKSKGRGEAE